MQPVTESDGNNRSYETIKTLVKRIKVESTHQGVDSCIHYVHATEIKRCYVFAMAYALVMDDSIEPSNFMFPSWETQVKFTKKGTESQVSQKFAKCMGTMIGIAQEYIKSLDEMKGVQFDENIATKVLLEVLVDESAGKTLYMGKKYGIQKLGDSNLAPQVCLYTINNQFVYNSLQISNTSVLHKNL